MAFLRKVRNHEGNINTFNILQEAAKFESVVHEAKTVDLIDQNDDGREKETLPNDEETQQRTVVEGNLTTTEFVQYIISTVEEENKLDIWKTLLLYTPSGTIVNGEATSIENAKKLVFDEEDEVDCKFTYQGKREKKEFVKPFTKAQVDAIFRSMNQKKILDYLESTTSMLSSKNEGSDGLNFVSYNKDFISYDLPSRFSLSSLFNDRFNKNIDKEYAIIISGESGSGKSQFAVNQPKELGFDVFYRCMDPEDLKDKPKDFTFGRASGWHKFLLQVISKLESTTEQLRQDKKNDTNKTNTDMILALDTLNTLSERLYKAKRTLNKDRNDWVNKVVEQKLGKGANEDINHWLDGMWPKDQQPEKLAVVFDEATDLDFAAGLVDNVRDFISKYSKILCRGQLRLVIAGTGLDSLTAKKKTSDSQYPYSLGTNPSKLRVILLKSPDLDQLSEKLSDDYKVVIRAGKEGILSRILLTNARMCFNGVLPILNMNIHKSYDTVYASEDAEGTAAQHLYEERLKDIGGYRYLMDFPVRYYLSTNSIGHWELKDREDLLKGAFVFHLMDAIENAIKEISKDEKSDVQIALERQYEKLNEDFGPPNQQIFEKGLAVQNGPTSTALKFISCFGATCGLRKSFGDDLEALVSLHVERLAQLDDLMVVHRQLTKAWPKKCSKSEISTEDVLKMKEELMGEEEPWFFNPTNDIKSEKVCVIFSQGSPQAQGGDRFVLWIDGNETAYLDSIQCKHHATFNGDKFKNGWNSLGIDWTTRNETNLHPNKGSAGWSFTGLDCFRQRLESALNRKVILRSRILATSLSASKLESLSIPKELENDESSSSSSIEIWCREMLEPTISTINIQEPHD